jgi:hypothetical protein
MTGLFLEDVSPYFRRDPWTSLPGRYNMLSPDNRGLELLRVVSYGGKPQVWLMGEKLLG